MSFKVIGFIFVTVNICNLVIINGENYINSLSNKTVSRTLDRQQKTYTHVYILIFVYV